MGEGGTQKVDNSSDKVNSIHSVGYDFVIKIFTISAYQ